LPSQAFGKDVANLGLYRSLVRYGGFEAIQILTAQDFNPADLGQGPQPAITRHDLLDLYAPCAAGVLLRGQPYLAELAWIRSAFRSLNAYSLVGVIHTLAPPAVRELIGAAAVAPVQPWDALICTSPSVRQGLEAMFAQWHHYLQERFGVQRFTLPQLPVIPLAVDLEHLQQQGADPQARASLRAELGIADHEVMVLWVGRLSYFEKAFPQGMFIALQRAHRQCGVQLRFCLAGWFPDEQSDAELFREAAQRHCPDVPVAFLDGRNQSLVDRCWAAADVFISLVDNPQETFGLAPVEAMAAGLPVVVSDWDGYRSTVRDGVDGFRIPTLAGPACGIGDELAARHSVGLFSYQDYVGAVAQHTAVDPEAAALALARLASSPELRRQMGQAGQQNVRDHLDWPVVIRQYLDLFAELAAIRGQAPHTTQRRSHPFRGNPFADFAHFATAQLAPRTLVALNTETPSRSQQGLGLEGFAGLDLVYGGCHASQVELQQLLALLQSDQPQALETLLAAFPGDRHQALAMGVVWLAKLGVIRWITPEELR
jgi:D-inositol-3-phosphate glycosyltransferase